MTRPSETIASKLDIIAQIFKKYAVENPRVFGSVANGSDTETSDCDVLVDLNENTTFDDLIQLEAELTAKIGVKFDVKTPNEISRYFREEVLKSARPLIELAA